MSRHWQFEARMSLTGANADQRVAVRNSEAACTWWLALHNAVAAGTGNAASSR
jgi:hypothetical protein